MKKISKLQIVILCGGLASRLGDLTRKTPKSLIEINNKSFISLQLDYLNNFNVDEVILCCGHLHEKIIDHISIINKNYKFKIRYSIENKKMGTGGALINAFSKLKSNFILIYGDSYVNINIENLHNEFINNDSLYMITTYRNKNINYFNNIFIKNKKIIKYDKKKNYNFIDYGVSVLDKKILNYFFHETNFDLSKIIKFSVQKNIITYFESKKKFQEIGSSYGIKLTKKYLINGLLTN
jgi:NDP-sugar pyrophosphorylase family protein